MSRNPFSSRSVLPDAVPFFFPATDAGVPRDDAARVETLIDKLLLHGGHGQIVGPHASGKTTLLSTMVRGLRTRGVDVFELAFRDRQRELTAAEWNAAAAFGRSSRSTTTSIAVVDGFEQLSFLESFRIRILLRRCGLLLTAHRRAMWLLGFPVLLETHSSLAITERVVAHLLRDAAWRPSPQEVAALHKLHGGNVRLVLCELYDRYEEATPPQD